MDMNEQARKQRERELLNTWGSYEWLIKKKIEELDYLTRDMQRELSKFYVPPSMSGPFIQEHFARIWNEVAAEQATKYGSNGARIIEKERSGMRTVIPNHRNEPKVSHIYPVKPYQLSPEEHEKYKQMPPPPKKPSFIDLPVGGKERTKRGRDRKRA